MDIICLHNILVGLFCGPHSDIPDDARLSAQVIIDELVFLQTIPVKMAEMKETWKLEFDCNIPPSVLSFSIALLCESPKQVTRLLGMVPMQRGDVLRHIEQKQWMSRPITKVNSDGPLVFLTAGFSSFKPSSGAHYLYNGRIDDFQSHFQDICGNKWQVSLKQEMILLLSQMLECVRSGEQVDPLEISMMHERLLLLPWHDNNRATFLNRLGDVCSNCHSSMEVNDLNRAVTIYGDAVRETTADSKQTFLMDLGICLWNRFNQLGDLADLNKSIQVEEDAILLTPDGDPYKPSYLNSLGVSLQSRFEELGDVADLNLSIQTEETAILLLPDRHSHKSQCLINLGNSLHTRFKQLGNLDDLTRSIQVLEDVVLLISDEHPNKPMCLSSLGLSLHSRFEQLGNLDDLSRSIQIEENIVLLTPNGDPNKASYLNNLGLSLQTRFDQLGDPADLNRSIQVKEEAVLQTPDGHPAKPVYLDNLGTSFHYRFKQVGDIGDLNRSIQVKENAVLLTPDGHFNKPSYLSNLGSSLQSRFKQLGNLDDLNRTIQVSEDAVLLTHDRHSNKPSHLYNLGLSLQSRFEKLGDLGDLDRSIQVKEAAILLIPDRHLDKSHYLNNLGGSLQSRFKQLGDLNDLERSIQVFEEAVLLTPDGHPEKPGFMHNLGSVLHSHFLQLSDLADLNRSVQVLENAVQLIPDGHPDKPMYFNSFGNSLQSCFEWLSDLADLNKCIQVQEDAVILTPVEHVNRPTYLNDLGHSLQSRFKQLGDLSDLNRSIQIKGEAVSLIPDSHPDKPMYLSNLGNSLQSRFEHLGDLDDLNRSIQVHKDAVLLTPIGHPNRAGCFNSLGISLRTGFEELKELDYLKQSIQVLEDAVRLTPDSHPKKPACLNSLGNSLLSHFQQFGDLGDLDRSIQLFEHAVLLTPDGHLEKPSYLYNHGASLYLHFEKLNFQDDLNAAILCFSSAAQSITGSPHIRFAASSLWAKCSHSKPSLQPLSAYTVAIHLVPQLAWLGSTIYDRHHQIIKAGRIVRDAAAAAVAAGQYDTAVEWLEQGRSIIWGQLLQLRSPVDKLRQVKPEFANSLLFLSAQLEGASSQNMKTGQKTLVKIDYHQLAHEWEKLLKQIRQLPGFDRFLLPKTLSQLLSTANGRLTVMLNVSELGCDALILMPGVNNVLHVQLKDLTLERATAWRQWIQIIINKSILSITDFNTQLPRKAKQVPDPGTAVDREDVLAYILEELWSSIVKPVLDTIGIMQPMELDSVHHIWWCPTGPLAFLPIHAAGIYPSGPKLSDFAVSSYTPTLSALINKPHLQLAEKRQLLTVALPQESQLPGTKRELECIEKHAKNFSVLRLFESEATPDRVSKGMKESNWVHFACHGAQDTLNPTESCLLLTRHSKLTLSEIIKLSLEKAELVFLSACETATGDKELQEEAVHLAAGMLLAGYHGVIATMWEINDGIAVQVADETYRHLFEEYNGNPTQAAEALHFAVKKVCEESKDKLSFFSWVPFIHMGV